MKFFKKSDKGMIQSTDNPIRLGAVSYLNTKPLVYGLAGAGVPLQLTFDLPSRLADRLARAELDVALIPTIEFFQDPGYRIVSDACIACRGPVLSVKLFSRVPAGEIRTLALDEGSRTSIAMLRILLQEKYGLAPQTQPLPIGESTGATDADAVLLIGDRAIHPPAEPFAEVWDLGEAWLRWSRTPFVFAMWTARAGVDVAAVEPALAAARDAGVAHLAAIAAEHAPRFAMTTEECLRYLRDNLHFFLGPREQRGLKLFYQHAKALGLAPDGIDLEAHGYQVA